MSGNPTQNGDESTTGPNGNGSVEGTEPASGSMSDRWRKKVWAAGSYERIAPNYARMGARLVERTAVDADDEVLDVGCGTGTVAISAARRDARVTGVDIQPALLERARENAALAGVDITWREGDTTALQFDADAFDVTLSNLGHMYGEPPGAAARNLVRVTRPGGRIGFTSWTPTSLYPAMAGAVMSVLTPDALPDFSQPPFLWGDPNTVRDRLGDAVTDLEFQTETISYPALSPEQFWRQTATNSGMFVEILEEVEDGDVPRLRDQLVETIEPHFDDSENAVELEYLLTTGTVHRSGKPSNP